VAERFLPQNDKHYRAWWFSLRKTEIRNYAIVGTDRLLRCQSAYCKNEGITELARMAKEMAKLVADVAAELGEVNSFCAPQTKGTDSHFVTAG